MRGHLSVYGDHGLGTHNTTVICMPCMHRNLALRTELGLVDMYSHASVQLMHFHGYVHVSALACLYTFRPRQHHCVPSQPFGIWPCRSDPHCSRACLGFSVFLDPGHGPLLFPLYAGVFWPEILFGFRVLNRPVVPRAFYFSCS